MSEIHWPPNCGERAVFWSPNTGAYWLTPVRVNLGVGVSPATITVDGYPCKPSDDLPLSQMLALAVLANDEAAEYALADDVFERRNQPEGFVSRWELMQEVARLKAENKELAEEVKELEREIRRLEELQWDT